MGFEDRDYSQEESWNSSAGSETPVTKWFVILTVAVFVLGLFSGAPGARGSALFELLILKPTAVWHGQVWRLFAFVITHHPADIIGLIFSLLIVWRFGSDLERMYGSRELLMYYLAMTLTVGLSFTLWGIVRPDVLGFGSFTVSLGLLTLFATHFPRTEVYILPMISIQLRWLVALYALIGVYPALNAIQAGDSITALADTSSLMCIPFALAYRRFDWHLAFLVEAIKPAVWKRAWRTRMARQRLRVYQPTESSNLDEKVDAILAKIHEQGTESLTDAERAVLTRASDRYKNRP